MRKTLGVAALMLALCCPAFAGEIPNPPAPTPPPAIAVQELTDDATLNGEMPNLGEMPNGVLAQTALDLLALLPSLL
jgi:hypothetical protein